MSYDRFIQYRNGYKYQLAAPYVGLTDIHLLETISHRFSRLEPNGVIWIREDYAWDGPSGPTIDTPDSMRASLVHDCLYQFMRLGLLNQDYREAVDKEFLKILLEDGMFSIKASAWYAAVRLAAGSAADPTNDKPVLHAP